MRSLLFGVAAVLFLGLTGCDSSGGPSAPTAEDVKAIPPEVLQATKKQPSTPPISGAMD